MGENNWKEANTMQKQTQPGKFGPRFKLKVLKCLLLPLLTPPQKSLLKKKGKALRLQDVRARRHLRDHLVQPFHLTYGETETRSEGEKDFWVFAMVGRRYTNLRPKQEFWDPEAVDPAPS